MYPLQVLSIVHETCSLLGPRFNNGHIMLRKILTCWLISGVGAIHSLFDTVFSNGDGPEVDKCVKVPLFGNVILGISVESVRAVIFHVGFLFCLMELIYRNWQKLMFLKRVTGNWTLSDRLKRIRFMFIYAILMAMFWVPFGFVMSGYQVAEMSPELQEIKEQVDSNATFCKVWVTIFSVYIAYAPGVVFWIGDKRTDQRHCKPFCTLRSQPSVESATPAIVDFRMNDGGIRMQNLVNLNSDEIEMH
ncbi:uncharacterized protein LOC118433916 [Folsomia candida]|nr:uncharacterized protein LOC118433916 [Folsomia candida]